MTTLSPSTTTSSRSSLAQRVHEATPASRDRFVDALRLYSIGVVVLAHWVLVLIVVDGTERLGSFVPAQLLTWGLMVMPLFFAVGGYAHAQTLRRPRPYAQFVASRAERLMGPVVVLLLFWVVLGALGGQTGLAPLTRAADNAPTPLWFVAVYLVVILLAPVLFQLHARAPRWTMIALVVSVLLVDAVRFGLGWESLGTLNLLLVWVSVHQLGFFWADGTLTRPGVPACMSVLGLGGALLLTLSSWYPLDMQGLPGSPADNFVPPTLALLCHGAGLVGIALLVRPWVTSLVQRPAVWLVVVLGNRMIMTLFCWHLTAAYVTLGVLMLVGHDLPPALSVSWWMFLPVWMGACALLLVVFTLAARRSENWNILRPSEHLPRLPRPAGLSALGGLLAALGLYGLSQVGLDDWTSGAPEALSVVPFSLPAWPLLGMMLLGLFLLATARRSTTAPV